LDARLHGGGNWSGNRSADGPSLNHFRQPRDRPHPGPLLASRGDQSEVRPGRPFLRPPPCWQRSLEPRRVHSFGL